MFFSALVHSVNLHIWNLGRMLYKIQVWTKLYSSSNYLPYSKHMCKVSSVLKLCSIFLQLLRTLILYNRLIYILKLLYSVFMYLYLMSIMVLWNAFYKDLNYDFFYQNHNGKAYRKGKATNLWLHCFMCYISSFSSHHSISLLS